MILYRYRDVCDESGDLSLIEDQYSVLKETPCGWWVAPGPRPVDEAVVAHWLSNKRAYRVRFVLSGSGKRYAYPDKNAALRSYRRRKRAQIEHAENALARARFAIKSVDAILDGKDEFRRGWRESRILGNPFNPFKG